MVEGTHRRDGSTGDTGVCEKTLLRRRSHVGNLASNTQKLFLPLRCKAKALVKGMCFVHRRRYGDNENNNNVNNKAHSNGNCNDNNTNDNYDINLSIHLSIYLSTYLSISLSLYIYIYI